jgi:hypothetical protein
MLFILHCTIEPEHRDENRRRLGEMMIGEPADVQVLGSWLSVTQLEGWVVFEAPDAASVVRLFHNWTDLNVNHVTPIMTVEDLLGVVGERD